MLLNVSLMDSSKGHFKEAIQRGCSPLMYFPFHLVSAFNVCQYLYSPEFFNCLLTFWIWDYDSIVPLLNP